MMKMFAIHFNRFSVHSVKFYSEQNTNSTTIHVDYWGPEGLNLTMASNVQHQQFKYELSPHKLIYWQSWYSWTCFIKVLQQEANLARPLQKCGNFFEPVMRGHLSYQTFSFLRWPVQTGLIVCAGCLTCLTLGYLTLDPVDLGVNMRIWLSWSWL